MGKKCLELWNSHAFANHSVHMEKLAEMRHFHWGIETGIETYVHVWFKNRSRLFDLDVYVYALFRNID